MMFKYTGEEHSSCGVGFIASKNQIFSNEHLKQGLSALHCEEHRGACSADQITGDGAGIMTDIPWDILGYDPLKVAVASLFTPKEKERKRIALSIFETNFKNLGLDIIEFRDVPIDYSVLGPDALETCPGMVQAIIKRPDYCRTDFSFDKLLHRAKQMVRIKQKEAGIVREFFFASLSATTIVYKALTKGNDLGKFYLDLQNPKFTTRFCLFHRRFSTNTRTSWDRAQPFRLIGHNGEINTIAGNRSWGFSRGKALEVQKDQLLTHSGISDSGSFNEMVEAIRYRSGVPHVEDTLAMMVPPANQKNDYYTFWSRAIEPWDGPALIVYAEGHNIGARLDRNGFRPCRWAETRDHFYLSSEAGSFSILEEEITAKGSLNAGTGVSVDLDLGEVLFRDPSQSFEHKNAKFDARLLPIQKVDFPEIANIDELKRNFGYTKEELAMVLYPMIDSGKEAIGSMGDTASMAVLSDQTRSFFDFFYQNFAQVTNPPLDYLREKMVTDMKMYLGKKPNIFEPKELLPPTPALELESPVLSLGNCAYLHTLENLNKYQYRILPQTVDICFERTHGVVGARKTLQDIRNKAVEAAKTGHHVLILSDKKFSYDRPALPILLALREAVNALNQSGLRLTTSIVIESGQIKNTHDFAACVGFGAAAICPYTMLEIARSDEKAAKNLTADEREKNVIHALEQGLLKIMSKMGISVVRSYQSAKLFTAVGLGPKLIKEFFPGLQSPLGGYELDEIVELVLKDTAYLAEAFEGRYKPMQTYQYKEHAKDGEGERHSMTRKRSLVIHDLVRKSEGSLSLDNMDLYEAYLKSHEEERPVHIRNLFSLIKAEKDTEENELETVDQIATRFGSGAMSFGAISAESQRDIFLAFNELGGRSNSGEGGENPYYFTDGISATTKQIASGRFGVTAEYLVTGKEIQIKVAQGAKPGEGGQLMGIKVNADIAKARFANEGVSLISPPPLHDIYSIEDLKELIYELKQVNPKAKVCVKLVSGAHIGTIAVGVAKAGADVIHVSGGDGGTGAASLSSMKHAGLAWELGLFEVHQALIENGMRSSIILRTDGGLSTGIDVIMAAIFGAEEFDFGKLLLIAEGCVMARICEKNTCPTGIATHDPKFKAKYAGNKEQVKTMLRYLANDVRRHLKYLGCTTIDDLLGRVDLIKANENHYDFINQRKLRLNFFLDGQIIPFSRQKSLFKESISFVNQQLLSDTAAAIEQDKNYENSYSIQATDRAVLSTLSGKLAMLQSLERKKEANVYKKELRLNFTGSAGQGFGVFLNEGLRIYLNGEANDSVAKGMSGGFMAIRPAKEAKFEADQNTIIGNVALYGATGGKILINGLAGDRFAVRNSGAIAVVEGTGLHACEYMTNGKVVILGKTSDNVGGGMTGGELIFFEDQPNNINTEYLGKATISDADLNDLKSLLEEYVEETNSTKWRRLLGQWDKTSTHFVKYLPIAKLKEHQEAKAIENK